MDHRNEPLTTRGRTDRVPFHDDTRLRNDVHLILRTDKRFPVRLRRPPRRHSSRRRRRRRPGRRPPRRPGLLLLAPPENTGWCCCRHNSRLSDSDFALLRARRGRQQAGVFALFRASDAFATPSTGRDAWRSGCCPRAGLGGPEVEGATAGQRIDECSYHIRTIDRSRIESSGSPYPHL